MLSPISQTFRALAERYSDWRRRQQAFAELAQLDDRSLADIGITRSEIPYVLSHAAERPAETGTPANSNFQHAA